MKKQIYSQYVIAFEQKNDILDQLNLIKEKMKGFLPYGCIFNFWGSEQFSSTSRNAKDRGKFEK